jgi:aspartate racemase
VVLCTNTMHKVADAIIAALDIPFLHLVDVTADAISAQGLQNIALLGTRSTMSEPFYRERMADHGLTMMIPTEQERRIVNAVIYDELVVGIVRDESREAYNRIIGRMVTDGAEGVILGCTEIEMLVGPDDVSVPCFPTTALHARAAVDFALSSGGRERRRLD